MMHMTKLPSTEPCTWASRVEPDPDSAVTWKEGRPATWVCPSQSLCSWTTTRREPGPEWRFSPATVTSVEKLVARCEGKMVEGVGTARSSLVSSLLSFSPLFCRPRDQVRYRERDVGREEERERWGGQEREEQEREARKREGHIKQRKERAPEAVTRPSLMAS